MLRTWRLVRAVPLSRRGGDHLPVRPRPGDQRSSC